MSAVWLQTESNDKAHSLSRKSDCDDWEIEDIIFRYLDNFWGHFLQIGLLVIITRNANNFFPSSGVPVQQESFWCPGTAGIDAFRFTWACTNNWLVPPPRLIPQVINKLEHEKCKGTLIVPEWASAPFWPMVVNKDGHFGLCLF